MAAESRGFGCGGLVALLLVLAYCGHASRRVASLGPADSGAIRGGETYNEYDVRRDALDTGRYSGDDECTQDCSGHAAGRQWAEDHDITDPDDCGGKSWSFNEGCREYAEEQSGDDKGVESSDD